MTKLSHIKLSEEIRLPLEVGLLPILEKLMPIKFSKVEKNLGNIHGFIQLDGLESNINGNLFPSLIITGLESSVKKDDVEVTFANDDSVPFPFRNRTIRTKLSFSENKLSIQNDEKVLASTFHGPIWTVARNEKGARFRSLLSLPDLTADQNFSDVFNGDNFLEVLILLEFIREISPTSVYQNAPLRACYIIDDPNLHWSKYGYVDYQKIVSYAKNEKYHISFATIPLDSWYTNDTAAKIFRENSKHISLLIHGNNHAKKELALAYTVEERRSLLKQAIQRINKLEGKAKLPISKVMIPPHGACSDEMLSCLPDCGFESACISAGSLRAHNKDKEWTKTLGFYPSELINDCPVLPRWGLSGNIENTLLIAAYLGQPLILRGHHQDLKNDGEIFNNFAKFINSIGDVTWSNMTDLSCLNYQWKFDGKHCQIKPFGINTIFKLPPNTVEITIESHLSCDHHEWQIVAPDNSVFNLKSNETMSLPKNVVGEIFIKRINANQGIFETENWAPTPTKTSLVVRRLLTEFRDRLLMS